jgi:hypothetical protein
VRDDPEFGLAGIALEMDRLFFRMNFRAMTLLFFSGNCVLKFSVMHMDIIYKILFYAYNAKNECFNFSQKKFPKG